MHEQLQMKLNGLKIDDVALNGAFWAQKNYGVQISLKNIEVPV